MRGRARSTRVAIPASCSRRANSRSLIVGISAISRAIAVCARSLMVEDGRLDRQAQIAAISSQYLGGFGRSQTKTEKDGDLHVALAAVHQAHGVGFRASYDLAHHALGAATQ